MKIIKNKFLTPLLTVSIGGFLLSACAQPAPAADDKLAPVVESEPANDGAELAPSDEIVGLFGPIPTGPCRYDAMPSEVDFGDADGDGTLWAMFKSSYTPINLVRKNVTLSHPIHHTEILPGWMYDHVDGNCDDTDLRPKVRSEEYFAITDSVIAFSSEGQIEPGASDKIEIIAAAFSLLKADYPKMKLIINGYTDRTRSAEYSLALGDRYANRVMEIISDEIDDTENIKTLSWGSKKIENLSSTLPENRATMTVELNQNLTAKDVIEKNALNRETVINFLNDGEMEVGSVEALKHIAALYISLIPETPKMIIRINGHSRKNDSREVSLAASEKYADMVKNILKANDVAEYRIEVSPWGHKQPKYGQPSDRVFIRFEQTDYNLFPNYNFIPNSNYNDASFN